MTFPVPHEALVEVAVVDAGASPTATIRFHGITQAALKDCYDAAAGSLRTAVGSGAIAPAGPMLGIYRGDPAGTFDLEVGFPLAAPLEQESTFDGFPVREGTDLAGKWAGLSHVGPYDTLPEAWGLLMAAVAELGLATGPVFFEAYVTDPLRTPSHELRTDLFISLV